MVDFTTRIAYKLLHKYTKNSLCNLPEIHNAMHKSPAGQSNGCGNLINR